MAEEKLVWNVDLEVGLFHAMRKHKPVGVNRHFQMTFIHDKLNSAVRQKISSKQIWQHLETMYDLAALNESEIVTFPKRQSEFDLTSKDFEDLKSGSFPRVMGKQTTGESDPDPPTPSVPERKSKAAKEAERGTDSPRVEESPKREQRKRTRQNVNTPTPDNTPKRARRN